MKCYCTQPNETCDACRQRAKRERFNKLVELGVFAVGKPVHFYSGGSQIVTAIKPKVFRSGNTTRDHIASDIHEALVLSDGLYTVDCTVEWCEGSMALCRNENPITEIANYIQTL